MIKTDIFRHSDSEPQEKTPTATFPPLVEKPSRFAPGGPPKAGTKMKSYSRVSVDNVTGTKTLELDGVLLVTVCRSVALFSVSR